MSTLTTRLLIAVLAGAPHIIVNEPVCVCGSGADAGDRMVLGEQLSTLPVTVELRPRGTAGAVQKATITMLKQTAATMYDLSYLSASLW